MDISALLSLFLFFFTFPSETGQRHTQGSLQIVYLFTIIRLLCLLIPSLFHACHSDSILAQAWLYSSEYTQESNLECCINYIILCALRYNILENPLIWSLFLSCDVGFSSVCNEYVLLSLVNKEIAFQQSCVFLDRVKKTSFKIMNF